MKYNQLNYVREIDLIQYIHVFLFQFYKDTLYKGGYWEDGRRHIDNCYSDFKLPFDDVQRYEILI